MDPLREGLGKFPPALAGPREGRPIQRIPWLDHSGPLSLRKRPDLPLCPAVERLGYRPKEPWPA